MSQLTTGNILQQLLEFARQLAKDPQNSKLLQAAQSFLKGLQRRDITQAVADLEAKQTVILAAAPRPGDQASLSTPLLALHDARRHERRAPRDGFAGHDGRECASLARPERAPDSGEAGDDGPAALAGLVTRRTMKGGSS